MRINKLEIENVKRVKAVTIEPAPTGLTVIGGRNAQGKTSVLDSLAWALGGEKYRPAKPERDGSVLPPMLRVELDNGIVVERKGKNSSLTVTDAEGKRAGQQLLDAFVEKLALDLPRFMQASDKEKGTTLLRILGVEAELKELRAKELQAYNQRHAIGQIADQKMKAVKEMPEYPDAPADLLSPSDLIQRQQEILLKNAENQKLRARAAQLEKELADAQAAFEAAKQRLVQLTQDAEIARKDALELQDESTEALERDLANVEGINRQVRANLDRNRASEEAQEYARQYNELSDVVTSARWEIVNLMAGAALPLPELTVDEEGVLVYKGHAWSDMSSAEQLMVATAIVRKLNPECQFVLIDKLEQMDVETMQSFGKWLEQEGLQAICTRVSTGAECQIIIEDGLVVGTDAAAPAESAKSFSTNVVEQRWKEGEF